MRLLSADWGDRLRSADNFFHTLTNYFDIVIIYNVLIW